MREIRIEEEENFCWTETGVNPGSPSDYAGSVTHWQCGCVTASAGYRAVCPNHTEIPPVVRRLKEPVTVNSLNRATTTRGGEVVFLVCSTEHLKKIRRRAEDALRKGGAGQILRCAEILGVSVE